MADELAKDVIRDWERGQADRATWLTHCQEVADYVRPDRADFTVTRSPGQKRMQKVFDATPGWASDQATAGLHSYLTSPYLPWFSQHFEDDRIDRLPQVRAWLEAADWAMYQRFNGPRHNFASQSQELYHDLVDFGGAFMAVLESSRNAPLFSTRHMREVVLFENDEDRIDHFSRRWQWTAKQGWDQWGARAGEQVGKAYAEGQYAQKFWFHHRVKPRRNRDPQRADPLHKLFESVFVSEADQSAIEQSGYDEFPAVCPRLGKITGEVMGRGWGHTMLPDIKMLNALSRQYYQAGELKLRPPMMLPDDGFVVPIKTTPGALNYYRAGTRPTDRIAPILTGVDVATGEEMIAALRTQILRGYYVEYLLMPSDPRDPASAGKGITATYVLQKRDEQMRLLSPVLARLQSEFLEPLIDRTFAILWRQSAALKFAPGAPFPPPPPEIARGGKTRIEYVSPIAVAQKSSRNDAVRRMLEMQLALRQMDPDTPMVLDGEAILRLEAYDLNAPTEALKSPARLRAEAAAKARMIEQQHNAQIAAQGAGAVADMANARQTLQQPEPANAA